MGEARNKAYAAMYGAYLKYEAEYWRWAQERKLFAQRKSIRYYYRKGLNRDRRKKKALEVLIDFPKASFRDVHGQIGGDREIVAEFGLWEDFNNPYYFDVYEKWRVFEVLKRNPEQLYEAIEETYEWSKEIGVRTTLIERVLPEILKDIGEGTVW